MLKKYLQFIIIILIQFPLFFCEHQSDINLNHDNLFRSQWVQTSGPTGGFINDIAMHPDNEKIMYAAGSFVGIYKTTDGGETWELLPFIETQRNELIEVDPHNGNILYSDYNNFSRSTDGGRTWQEKNADFKNEAECNNFIIDPVNPENIYLSAVNHDDDSFCIYKSSNGAESWEIISMNLEISSPCWAAALAIVNNKLFIAVNSKPDENGRLFYTDNDGNTWQEIDYGASENRYIISLYSDPYNPGNLWISEGPVYNEPMDQPLLYLSEDSGNKFERKYINVQFDSTQVRIAGAGQDGKVNFFGGNDLFYTENNGNSFVTITLPKDEIRPVDPRFILINPLNLDELFIPLRSGGIAKSSNCGVTWKLVNNGIIASTINLLAVSPDDSDIVFGVSTNGDGLYRTLDGGTNWSAVNKGGIVHPWGDEITIDPNNPDIVWYTADVPFLQKSNNRGDNWEVILDPRESSNMNFCSVYAISQSKNDHIIYALNNGFGIFKGYYVEDNFWNWEFLKHSEIDYTYTLITDPEDPNIVYSGYNRKPFEDHAKIRISYDGGESWFTSLKVEGANAISSIVLNPLNPEELYSVSVGVNGASIFLSENSGQTWSIPNPYFNFTTIHSFAINSSNAFAGVWGGGTYRTDDSGRTWQKIDFEGAESAAYIAMDKNNSDIIYIADRTKPVLYRSDNGGNEWYTYLELPEKYYRLMSVTVIPEEPDKVIVTAMKMGNFGMNGSVIKYDGNNIFDITGSLPRLALNTAIDPDNPNIIYTVLHESGVYKTTDGGSNWQDISLPELGLLASGFNNIIIDPESSNTLYLIGGCDVKFRTFDSTGLDPDLVNGVYKSTNSGLSWENINRQVLGEQSGPVKSLCFYKENIYIGCENGIYVSEDKGESWKIVNTPPYSTLGGIGITGNRIIAFTNGAGIFTGNINENLSITWDEDQKIITNIYFAQMLKDPLNNNVVYASAYPGGIFKSTDKGITWHEANFGMASFSVEDPLRQGYYAMDICDSSPEFLYIGLYGVGVYRSFNGTATWYPVNGMNQIMRDKKITGLVIDHNNPELVYVSSEDGVFKTTDGGQNWEDITANLITTDIRILYLNFHGDLYAGSRGYGLFKWENGRWNAQNIFGNFGTTWPMWDDRPMYQYTSILIHPEDSEIMLLGTFPQGIYKSTNGGNNWHESNIGWTMDGVFRLVCHPQNPDIVYAGTYNGINRSLDFGEHWEMWNNGWPAEQWVFSIDFNPDNPDIMYACSKNGENEGTGSPDFHGTVMKTINGGETWFEITDGLNLGQEFYEIIVFKNNPDTIFLAAEQQGIMISINAGETWEDYNQGLINNIPATNGNNVTRCLVISYDNSVLYFGTAGSGVFKREIY